MAKTMTTQERFFYDHGGFSYDPQTETRAQGKRRCAVALAEAETWAEQMGMTFEWEWDFDGDFGDHDVWCKPSCGKQHEVTMVCAKYRDGQVAGSLCGIIDADANYRRVIEAELASEAQAEVFDSLMTAI